jgi:hypothetical protein
METQIGEYFETLGKKITVFFLREHDPSGRIIEEDIHQRAQSAAGRSFSMQRLAIHEEDISRFDLPPQHIKTTDSRARSFQGRYGHNAPTVELDALPPEELRRRVEHAVRGLIDWERWQHQVEVQEVELQCIVDIANQIKNLPQVPR